jgi:glycosyltransferase involved in cell wall biosynthesis
MRCMVVVPSLRRAGAETQAVDLVNGLADRGHEVHLCTFESELDQLDRVGSNVQFHKIVRRGKYNFSFVSGVARIIDDRHIQVVQGVLMFAILAASLAKLRTHTKPVVIGGVHTTVNRGFKQEVQDRLIYRRVLRRLDAIAFVCENQARHWIGKYPEIESLSRVIYNGIDPSRFRRETFASATASSRNGLQIPHDAVVFTCVAGFRREKGHRLLIKAFSQLDDRAYLLLAGDGEERRDIESLAMQLGIAHRVRFLGVVKDVRPIIASSNATILASTAVETFSMAMLESMALSVPVIAPRIGGLSEAIDHQITGLLFPVGDVDSLSACMAKIVKDTAFAQSMGAAAERKVSGSFTLSQMIDQSESLMMGLLNARR